MTLDEAIQHAEEVAETACVECADNHRQLAAWLRDYKRLLEQEPCEDAISRQAVLDGLASIAKAKAKSDAQKSLMGRVMFFTERLPSVKPQEQKTGHWIETWLSFWCSECKTQFGRAYKFCPNCGAKMESEEQI